ncbi:WAS/WASL-interacting protein family member 1-like [Onychostruthus taczanowskii]|uniref:WAS/WASL-interacting protein family member 1-like n=1 Tax=Onychostruthus taczanowskii TaxID=356909 RepID=UPI001B807199|nr:WAS/WASL-interacting protein family member 1-like [Onychostruthus taczanowskii]
MAGIAHEEPCSTAGQSTSGAPCTGSPGSVPGAEVTLIPGNRSGPGTGHEKGKQRPRPRDVSSLLPSNAPAVLPAVPAPSPPGKRLCRALPAAADSDTWRESCCLQFSRCNTSPLPGTRTPVPQPQPWGDHPCCSSLRAQGNGEPSPRAKPQPSSRRCPSSGWHTDTAVAAALSTQLLADPGRGRPVPPPMAPFLTSTLRPPSRGVSSRARPGLQHGHAAGLGPAQLLRGVLVAKECWECWAWAVAQQPPGLMALSKHHCTVLIPKGRDPGNTPCRGTWRVRPRLLSPFLGYRHCLRAGRSRQKAAVMSHSSDVTQQ